MNKCNKEKLNINVCIKIDNVRIEHEPIPEYSYKYKIKKVTCSYCKEKFMSNKLEADEIFGEDESYYSDTICPKCGKFDCVDITYESIEDALIRKDSKINSK